MADVFISYSRKNKDFVLRLVDSLRQRGINVWIDLDAIPPSAEWWQSIKDGIDGAHTFVPILTPELLTSPVCMFEMDYALKNNKRIVPLMHNEAVKAQTLGTIAAIEPTGFLAEILGDADLLDIARSNWRTVEKLNWIWIREQDDHETAVKQFIMVLNNDFVRVRLHTRTLTRARLWLSSGSDATYLLVGSELREAASWLTVYGENEPQATDEQRALIQASLDKEAADETERQRQVAELNHASRKARRNRRVAEVVTVLAVTVALIASLLISSAVQQQQAANEREAQANAQAAAAIATVTQAAVAVQISNEFANTMMQQSGTISLQALNAMVQRYPNESLAYQARGLALAELGNHAAAIADYSQAIKINPTYATAYLNRGLAQYTQGNIFSAITDYTAAIDLEPNLTQAYVNRGNAYLDQGDIQAAIADFEAALAQDDTYAFAYNGLGNAFAALGDFPQAIANYTYAIENDERYAAAYYNRGSAYLRQNDIDRGVQDLDTAIRLDPSYANAYTNRGLAYLVRGNYNVAFDDFQTVVRFNPNDKDAYINLADAAMKLSDYEAAVDALFKATRLDFRDALAHYKLGQAYFFLSQTTSENRDSIEHLRNAVGSWRFAEYLGYTLPDEIIAILDEVEPQLEAIPTRAP